METEAEKEAIKKINDFTAAADTSVGADKAILAMAALDAVQNADRVTPKMKRWVYLLSFGLPPIGLVFAIWYYRSGKANGKRVALICVILTIAAVLVVWISIQMLVASIPPETMQQIQSLNSNDLKDLKDLLQ